MCCGAEEGVFAALLAGLCPCEFKGAQSVGCRTRWCLVVEGTCCVLVGSAGRVDMLLGGLVRRHIQGYVEWAAIAGLVYVVCTSKSYGTVLRLWTVCHPC